MNDIIPARAVRNFIKNIRAVVAALDMMPLSVIRAVKITVCVVGFLFAGLAFQCVFFISAASNA